MRALRIGFSMLVVMLVALSTTYAIHQGGVGNCTGCHSMHSSNQSGSFLLQGIDPSSTCLACHIGSDAHSVATEDSLIDDPGEFPVNLTPGGNFGYLKKDYSWSGSSGPLTESGERHGHNIVADDYLYVADDDNTEAPGGTFDSTKLHCTSCHDPHGKYRRLLDDSITTTGIPIAGSGSYHNSDPPTATEAVGTYRLLAGKAYDPGFGDAFDQDPFAAVVTSSYNRAEGTTQTRVAYGKGIADWCAQCHAAMHTNAAPFLVHPVAESLGSTVAGIYDAYRGSGNMTGLSGDAYLSLVPFAEDTATYAQLATKAKNDDTNLAGPSSGDDVACLTCHRAHASGFEYAARWNPDSELLVVAGYWPGNDNGASPIYHRGRTQNEMKQAYYDRDPISAGFATYQRSLCNKCHGKD